MIIKRVELQNIKSFNDKTIVELSDAFNLVIGSNSGGKSNLLEITQAILSDMFFGDISFSDNNNAPEDTFFPIKIELKQINQTHLNKNILDLYQGAQAGPQVISIFLKIEASDIENLRKLQEEKTRLTDFENTQVAANYLKDILSRIDFSLNFESMSGKEIELRVENQQLIDGNQIYQDPIIRNLIDFLKQSRILFKYVSIYNFAHKKHKIDFYPYFFYIPPNRETINLTNEAKKEDLSPLGSNSTNLLSQPNITQDSRLSVWHMITRILAENYACNNRKMNQEFKDLIRKNLDLDFAVKRKGLDTQNIYEVKFKRTNNGNSVKLSSGEKEILNLITTLFIHKIRNGILLIDEPELHLHPRWQKRFLSLLLSMIKERNIQAIVVTHSGNFIRNDILSNLIRVYKQDGQSKIVLPDTKTLSRITSKDIFLLITSSNNEKIFFADKVILVEGPADRIIFESIHELSDDNQIIEIIEVFGKYNFKRYSDFLNIWKIPHFIIADNDYLKDVGDETVKKLYSTNNSKIISSLREVGNQNSLALLRNLRRVTKRNREEISEQDFSQLKSLVNYIQKRNVTKKVNLTTRENNLIKSNIARLRKDRIYILEKGEIEDYFGAARHDFEKILDISKKIRSKAILPDPELANILKKIIKTKI